MSLYFEKFFFFSSHFLTLPSRSTTLTNCHGQVGLGSIIDESPFLVSRGPLVVLRPSFNYFETTTTASKQPALGGSFSPALTPVSPDAAVTLILVVQFCNYSLNSTSQASAPYVANLVLQFASSLEGNAHSVLGPPLAAEVSLEVDVRGVYLSPAGLVVSSSVSVFGDDDASRRFSLRLLTVLQTNPTAAFGPALESGYGPMTVVRVQILLGSSSSQMLFVPSSGLAVWPAPLPLNSSQPPPSPPPLPLSSL